MSPSSLDAKLWIAWFIYWVLAARGMKKTVASESRIRRLLYQVPLAAGFAAIFSHVFDYGTLKQELSFGGPSSQWVGVALTFIGLSFSVWARLYLGRNWSGIVTLKEGHELVRTGPYALARHPIYTGLLLAVAGSALTAGKLVGIPAFLVIVASFVWKLRLEERFMLQQFGDQYERYRREVKALIPFLI